MKFIAALCFVALSSCSPDALLSENTSLDAVGDDKLREHGSWVQRAVPVGSQVLVVCGPWSGKEKLIGAKDMDWRHDHDPKGRVALVLLPSGEFEVAITNRISTILLSKDKLANISLRESLERKSFSVVASRPRTGTVDTLGFIREFQTNARLLWARVFMERGLFPEIAASEAKCIFNAQTH